MLTGGGRAPSLTVVEFFWIWRDEGGGGPIQACEQGAAFRVHRILPARLNLELYLSVPSACDATNFCRPVIKQ